MKCPKCKTDFKPSRKAIAAELGSIKSTAKSEAARINGLKGGRPKKKPSA